MQTAHTNPGTTFAALPCGRPFRFHHRGEAVIGLKAFFPGGDQAALVLTSTKAGLQSGNLLSAYDVGDVVELTDVIIAPSTKPESVTPGAGNVAQSGEIELHGGDLIFITTPQGDPPMRVTLRVNIQSGVIGRASGTAPVEIYSQWSVVRTAGNRTETLYEHKPTPAESVSVQV